MIGKLRVPAACEKRVVRESTANVIDDVLLSVLSNCRCSQWRTRSSRATGYSCYSVRSRVYGSGSSRRCGGETWTLGRFSEAGPDGLAFVGPNGGRLRRRNVHRLWTKDHGRY